MKTVYASTLELFTKTFRFWFSHLGTITGFMLIAGVGRAMQMQVAGPVSSSAYFWLEVIVEGARVLALAAIVGHGHVLRGVLKIGDLFRLQRSEWTEVGRAVRNALRHQWPVLLSSLLLFSLVAFLINKGNGLIADHPAVLLALKRAGLMHPAARSMPFYFFLKNLTIIPLTLVFEYCLLNWCLKQGKTQPTAVIS